MKTIFTLSRAITALALVLAALHGTRLPAQQPYLLNPGFEDIPGPLSGQGFLPLDWEQASNVGTPADTYSNDGSYGLSPMFLGNFTNLTAHSGERWAAAANGETFGQALLRPLQPGTTYRLRCFMAQSTRSDIRSGTVDVILANLLRPPLFQGEIRVVVASTTATTSTDWEERVVDFVAPTNAHALAYLLLEPRPATNGQFTYIAIDDVSLTGPPALAIDDAWVEETNGPAQCAVWLLGPASGNVSVDVVTVAASAGGADFTAVSNTVTFAPGEMLKLVPVPIINDGLREKNDVFEVRLSNPVGAPIEDGSAIVVIADDDRPADPRRLLAYDPANAPVTNNMAGVESGFGWAGPWTGGANNVEAGRLFGVNLVESGGVFTTDGSNTVSERILDTTTHADLTTGGKFGKDGTTLWLAFVYRPIAFPFNSTAGLTLLDGATPELTLGHPAGVATFEYGFQIHDLGSPAGVFKTSGAGRGTVTLVAKLTFDAAGDTVDFYFNPQAGNEPAASDIRVANSGANIQFDRVQFSSGPGNATIGVDEIRLGTSFLDVAPGQITPARLTATGVREGNSGLSSAAFEIVLTQPSTNTVRTDWNTADESGILGVDYFLRAGEIRFAPGQMRQFVFVPVFGDTLPEPDRAFELNIVPTSEIASQQPRAFAVINDDDNALPPRLIAYDGADYSARTTLTSANGGVGWNGAWNGNNNVEVAGLSAPGLATRGNRFTTDGNNTGSSRTIATTGHASLLDAGVFGRTGTTLWLSFLLREDARAFGDSLGLSLRTADTENLFIGFGPQDSSLSFTSAPGFFGVRPGGATAQGSVTGATRLVAARLSFGVSGDADAVQLFIDPPPGVEPLCPDAIAVGADAHFDRASFFSGPANTRASFDEIRIGTTFDTVVPDPSGEVPVITTQPVSRTVNAGGATNFTVTAFGSEPLSYQWLFNGTNLPGATSATLTLTNVQTNQAGPYSVVVSNIAGVVTSQVATLTVVPPILPVLVSYDGANYAAANSIAGLNGGTGWAAAWSGANNVAAGSLTFPNLLTSSNRFTTDGNNVNSFRVFNLGAFPQLLQGGKFGKDGTTLWMSFLIRRDALAANSFAGVSLFDNATEEVFIGMPFNQTRWGLHVWDFGNPGGITLTTSNVVTGQTVFMVVRLRFGTAGVFDTVDLFLNPTPGVAPTTPAATRAGANISFTQIRFGSGNTATLMSADEFRLGTTFDDVAPTAAPSLPTLAIAGTTVVEPAAGSAAAIFPVSLSRSSAGPVSVEFATSNVTALAGSDYVATNGVLTFNPGETNKLLTVLIDGHGADDETDETFVVVLTNPTNAVLGAATGVATILLPPLGGVATARSGEAAPGFGGDATWKSFNTPVINDAGAVAFSGDAQGAGLTAANDFGIWAGAPNGLALAVRENAPPGVAPGAVFTNHFDFTLNFSDSGHVLFFAGLRGAGITNNVNGAGLWHGPASNVQLLARLGNPPAVAEPDPALVIAALPTVAPMNSAGDVALNLRLGPDSVNATSHGIYLGKPDALTAVLTNGTPAPDVPGATFQSFPGVTSLNGAEQIGFDGLLPTVFGPGFRGFWITEPLSNVMRLTQSAPGTAGTFSGFFATMALNNSGHVAFQAFVSEGGAAKQGIWTGPPGALQLAAYTGQQAPGLPAGIFFAGFTNIGGVPFAPLLNRSNQLAFVARLSGASVTTSNDFALFAGPPGMPRVIAREGDPGPGTGEVFRDFDGIDTLRYVMNGENQVAFMTFAGAGGTNHGIWATDENGALQLVARVGTTLNVGGTDRTVSDLSLRTGSGGEDGLPRSFNDAGQLVFRALFSDNTEAILIANTRRVPAALTIPLAGITLSGGRFSLQIASINGATYTLEGNATLDPAGWVEVASSPGTGGPITLEDPAALGATRFYRLRIDLP